MGTATLSDRLAGQTIIASFFQDIKGILCQDFVGRDVNGIPASGQNLGNSAYPWGNIYTSSVILGGVALSTSQLEAPPYEIVSGKTRAGSTQPLFIVPSGSSPSFSISATSINLILQIAGATATWTADKTGIVASTAPSSNNTATINDSTAAGQAATRTWGEYGSGGTTPYYALTISAAGTSITARVGTIQAFKIGTEYFIARIDSSTSLTNAFRGFFFNSAGNPITRTTFSNGAATITLMNLGYVFLDADGTTVDTIFTGAGVNNAPSFAYTSPSSPATGDYWFDQNNSKWKRYNGSTWVIVSRILAGLVVSDATNCVAARSFDFYGLCRTDNTMELAWSSNTVIKGCGSFERANVNGNRISYVTLPPVWDTASNLAASTDRYNATVQASTNEYFYLTDKGETKISDMEPYWRPDLLAWYHPFNPWRAIGWNTTDASAHFQSLTLFVYGQVGGSQIGDKSIVITKLNSPINIAVSSSSGSSGDNTSHSEAQVTNLSQSITLSQSGTVEISLQPDGVGLSFVDTVTTNGSVHIYRGASLLASFTISPGAVVPCSGFRFIDRNLAAGTYTYSIKTLNTGGNIQVYYSMLVLKELKL